MSQERFYNLPTAQIQAEGSFSRTYVLVIYDISDNRRRSRMVKLLKGFGYRVQKSAFEAVLTKSQFNKLLKALEKAVAEPDSVRIYQFHGASNLRVFGAEEVSLNERVIVV